MSCSAADDGAPPRVAVVDGENRFLRWDDRRAVHAARLPHRSIHVLVVEPGRGRVLLQRRHRAKLTDPGRWDLSCSGHVEEPDYPAGPDDDLDAVYDAVARRELGEELGIDAAITRLGRFGPREPIHYEHLHLYAAESRGPFTLQESEVEEVRWVTPKDLEALASDPSACTGTLLALAEWARARGVWGATG